MANLNAFQQLETPAQCISACREGAAGYAALALAHIFSLAYVLNQQTLRPTLIGDDKDVISIALTAGLLLSLAGFFLLRRTRSPWLAGPLLIWAALGLFHPVTYALYGWAALAPLPMFAAYFGILAVRGSMTLRRF